MRAYNADVLRKVLAGHQIDHGERFEAVLHAAAMTAALGLELLEPAFDRAGCPRSTSVRSTPCARARRGSCSTSGARSARPAPTSTSTISRR